ATLGLRFLAGGIDSLVLSLVGTGCVWLGLGTPLDLSEFSNPWLLKGLAWTGVWLLVAVLYYTVLEGLYGAAVGKALCRLRVVVSDRNPAGLLRALVRALVYVVVPACPYWITYAIHPKVYWGGPTLIQTTMGLCSYVVLALLSCRARRRNGFAAAHDLLTDTRVISKLALESRPTLAVTESPPVDAAAAARTIGPYNVLATLEKSDDAEWLLGY